MKFWCDHELEELAKLLRLFGYDTVYESEGLSEKLYMMSRESGRIFLSRLVFFLDKPGSIVIPFDNLGDQINFVKNKLDLALDTGISKSRCQNCNVETIPAEEHSDSQDTSITSFITGERACPSCDESIILDEEYLLWIKQLMAEREKERL